ncbi:MAG: NUDIX domain-containing protein [Candidatus Aenigmarchaeota archaeon]|nr:NUDIX domain-containing protein [Candidatus Aenigmarchaeota archaeon]
MERSRGAVIFRKEGIKILYLLLHYESGHWDFVKGHVEKGENDEETVKREAKEETGLDIEILPSFKERITYFYRNEGKTISKEVVFYAAKAEIGDVKLSHEHKGFKWLLFEDALKHITFDNSKTILKNAHKFISKQNLKDFMK